VGGLAQLASPAVHWRLGQRHRCPGRAQETDQPLPRGERRPQRQFRHCWTTPAWAGAPPCVSAAPACVAPTWPV
jgi:hypothetical protein